jgi:hypothetical membrane protein
MNFNVVTISRICGVISPLTGLIFIWIAVHNSPWFRWTEEDLSVLGVNGSAAAFFNCGLVLTGLLSLAFVIGPGRSLLLRQPLEYAAILSLVFGSIALAIIGLVPRTNAIPHNIASGAFFILIPLGMFVIGLSLIKSTQLPLGIFSMVTAILMVGLQLAPWPWQGGAIPQLLSSLPWSLWMVTMGIRLLLGSNLVPE